MKKTIFLLAAFCLLLAGCGAGDTGDTPNETPAVSVQTPAPSQGEAPDNTATAPPAGNGETTAKNFDLERGVVTLNNGIEMPILGIGTFRLSNEQAENSVYWALRDGYRLIDTARIYGNEQGVGRGIQRAIDEGLVTREEIFVTTKMWTDDYDNGAEAIDRSLERLGLDYIDLMILHHSQPRNDVAAYQAMEQAGERHHHHPGADAERNASLPPEYRDERPSGSIRHGHGELVPPGRAGQHTDTVQR